MSYRTITAIATAPVPYGSFVALTGETCSPDPARTGIGGIAKRPHQAQATKRYEPGETVVVLTDGGSHADLAEGQRWVEVTGGRIAAP